MESQEKLIRFFNMGFDAATGGVRAQCPSLLSNSMWSVTGLITIIFTIASSMVKGRLNSLVIIQICGLFMAFFSRSSFFRHGAMPLFLTAFCRFYVVSVLAIVLLVAMEAYTVSSGRHSTIGGRDHLNSWLVYKKRINTLSDAGFQSFKKKGVIQLVKEEGFYKIDPPPMGRTCLRNGALSYTKEYTVRRTKNWNRERSA